MQLDFGENNWKSTCACRLTENEHKKRQKVQKEKDEMGERIGPKIAENNGKSASLWLKSQLHVLFKDTVFRDIYYFVSVYLSPSPHPLNSSTVYLDPGVQRKSIETIIISLLGNSNAMLKEKSKTEFLLSLWPTTYRRGNKNNRCVLPHVVNKLALPRPQQYQNNQLESIITITKASLLTHVSWPISTRYSSNALANIYRSFVNPLSALVNTFSYLVNNLRHW